MSPGPSLGSSVLCFTCRESVVLWLIWGQSQLWAVPCVPLTHSSTKCLVPIESWTPEAWRTNLFLHVFASLFIKIMCTAPHQTLGNQRKWCMPLVQLLMVFMSGPSLSEAAFPSRNYPELGCFHPAWSLSFSSCFLPSCLTSADDKIKARESNWLLEG